MNEPTLSRASLKSIYEAAGVKPGELLDPLLNEKHSSPRTVRWPDSVWDKDITRVIGPATPWLNHSIFVRHATMFFLKVVEHETGLGAMPSTVALQAEQREEEYLSAEKQLYRAPRMYKDAKDDLRGAIVRDVKSLRAWAVDMGYKELVSIADEFLVPLRVDTE
jgi:hypothetical protein